MTVGEEVTIVVALFPERPHGTVVLRAAIVQIVDRRKRNFRALYRGGIMSVYIGIAREGSDWCRGHAGPEVEALAVAQALR